ncbi:hypothetical protein GCK72_004373 [Caenorhabditis remanei]|uniref:Uncharacterized protein n=1 Tax=Caenorhabditis remanei TaxID=31234 RepID=A0A6A5HB29_CAERE|nr:hypothetical protein GCK72_004373 [Caenorhabditis remanei]KAF1764425.1 hypothetical protein GCK72_004373 [Caenorhabditis remanei]
MSTYFGQVVRNTVMDFYNYLVTNASGRSGPDLQYPKTVTDAVLPPEDLLKVAVKKLGVLKKEGGNWRQEALQNVLVLKLYNHIEDSNKELKIKTEVMEKNSSSV